MSIDDSIELKQAQFIDFLIAHEQYINEYFTIPLFYTCIFHSNSFIQIRSLIMSLLILRRFFQKVNSKTLVFDKIYLIAPTFAYIALSNTYTSTLAYSLVYSSNLFEGIFISLSTGYLSAYHTFLSSYIFHALYVLCRNTIKIKLVEIENTDLIELDTKIVNYDPPTFYERVYYINESVNDFINSQATPFREALSH